MVGNYCGSLNACLLTGGWLDSCGNLNPDLFVRNEPDCIIHDRSATLCTDKLAYFRIKELKDLLTQLGLSKQGKKQDLVDRILGILSDERVSGMWAKKNAVGKQEVAKLVDDIYRKMQVSGATDLASKGQVLSDSSNARRKEEVEDSYQMDKIRCPCGSSLQADSMIKCEDSKCHVWQHIGCVIIAEKPMEGVLPASPAIFYCELCRLTRADPFWLTVAHPLYPVKLITTSIPTDGTNPVQSVEKTFQLTRTDKDLLSKQDYDVQAWCMLLNDKVLFRMQWPQFTDLQFMLMFFVLLIDGLTGVPVRAINRPGSQLLGANGRDDGPIITPCTRDGINKISLTGCDSRVFCLGVRIVKRRTVQQSWRCPTPRQSAAMKSLVEAGIWVVTDSPPNPLLAQPQVWPGYQRLDGKARLLGCDLCVMGSKYGNTLDMRVRLILNLIPKESEGEQFEEALARVRRCVGGGTAMENADSDSDLEIVADAITVNLRCPMSGSRMKVAGRFKPCLHMGCFDLDVFVEMNQRSRKWQCPICLKNYALENIIIDPYFNRITSKMRDCGEDMTEIEVKHDGSWRAKAESYLGDLGLWHYPDGTLCAPTDGEVKPKSESFKQIKQEGVSDGHANLKLGIKKNRNGLWEVSKPEDTNALSSGNRLEKFENLDQNVIPMSSSATGSGRDGDDPSVNQGGGGNFDFSANNGIELDSLSLNIDQPYGFTNQSSAPFSDAELIVLSDSEEENDIMIPSETVYKNNRTDTGGATFPLPPHGIPDLYPDDPPLGTAGPSCLGLFNSNEDEYGMPIWSLPPGTRAGPSFQLFGSDADVTDALVDLEHGTTNCPTSMNGYALTAETTMRPDAFVPQPSVDHSNGDINDSLVDNPLAFGRDDPSLQIFLPTRPSDPSMQPILRDQPDVSNCIRSEDWISLRLGGGGPSGQVESTAENGLNSQQQLQAKEGTLDSLADTASLLLGMNDHRSGKPSRERSDSPFSFPRQRRSEFLSNGKQKNLCAFSFELPLCFVSNAFTFRLTRAGTNLSPSLSPQGGLRVCAVEEKMEVKELKVAQQPLMMTNWAPPKRQSHVVLGMSREAFPVSHSKWKTLDIHCDSSQSIWQSAVSKSDSSKLPELSFNRLQLSDQECIGLQKRNFGMFVAREAVLDEEYWTAAWLRAEAHWESLSYMRSIPLSDMNCLFLMFPRRHVDSYKRKYAEQEFYALKRRCTGQDGNSLKCSCFVAVKKEDKNKRRTVLNSVVGTLDLSMRQFLQGETYPGEVKRLSTVFACQEPCDAHKYAYVANVCVSKFARRQGIASNMLYLATDVATLSGMKQLFVHVNADNKPAQQLYQKTGFKIVEAASSPLSKDQRLLMNMEL
ncbi:hypothetical protein RHMOL_Rhmol13G0269000 [Rhododendron molle]|uniref:Uncharacterized protein n=1 Tax=Rhododendron molle TaxID=49168 RepID=A0ACC0LBJ2_RHOML|nr:hypothetical protein RHMOL_Rhmol13G0269000 [Rhododendron molle]